MLYRADWLARLMALLMLVTASLSAWPNLTSGNFAWPQASVGADSPPNPLSYQENSAPKGGECVGYACFGQAANQAAGKLIDSELGGNEDSTEALLLHAAIGAAQGAIAGGGAGSSIAGGAAGATVGTYISPALLSALDGGNPNNLTAGDRTILTATSSLAGALLGGAAGGGAGAAAGASGADYSTTYNCLEDGCVGETILAGVVIKAVAKVIEEDGPEIVAEIENAVEGKPQILLNAQQGRDFAKLGLDYVQGVNTNVVSELSVTPFVNPEGDLASFGIRFDAVGIDGDGTINQYVFKSSLTAPFTTNQIPGYDLFEQFGGVVRGQKGGFDFPAGTELPPGPVTILRPGSFGD